MIFTSFINGFITCSKPEDAFEKLAGVNSRLRCVPNQASSTSVPPHHEDVYRYTYLLREATELVLKHAQLRAQQNRSGVTHFSEISILIIKTLFNFKEQKSLLEKHPYPQHESVQKKIKATNDLIAKYEAHAHLFAFSQRFPAPQDLSGKTKNQQKLDEDATREKIKRLKREAKKRRLKKRKSEANFDTLTTRDQLFPVLAIRCGLSKKAKDKDGFYILHTPHSSYNALHIIADYINLKKTSLINQ